MAITIGSWNAGSLPKTETRMGQIVSVAVEYDIFCMQEIGALGKNGEYMDKMQTLYASAAAKYQKSQNDERKPRIYFRHCADNGTAIFIRNNSPILQIESVFPKADNESEDDQHGRTSRIRTKLDDTEKIQKYLYRTIHVIQGQLDGKDFELWNVYVKKTKADNKKSSVAKDKKKKNQGQKSYRPWLDAFLDIFTEHDISQIDYFAIIGDFNGTWHPDLDRENPCDETLKSDKHFREFFHRLTCSCAGGKALEDPFRIPEYRILRNNQAGSSITGSSPSEASRLDAVFVNTRLLDRIKKQSVGYSMRRPEGNASSHRVLFFQIIPPDPENDDQGPGTSGAMASGGASLAILSSPAGVLSDRSPYDTSHPTTDIQQQLLELAQQQTRNHNEIRDLLVENLNINQQQPNNGQEAIATDAASAPMNIQSDEEDPELYSQ